MKRIPGLLLFPALFILLLSPGTPAQIDLDKLRHKQELDALRGLKSFALMVTVGPPGAKHDGLEEAEIRSAITTRLARQGAPIVTTAAPLTLGVSIRVRYDARLRGYAVALGVSAWSFVGVERSNSFERVILWERDDLIITDPRWGELRTALAAMVDEFASDFLISNPEAFRRAGVSANDADRLFCGCRCSSTSGASEAPRSFAWPSVMPTPLIALLGQLWINRTSDNRQFDETANLPI